MSIHQALVVPVKLEPHPFADTLSLVLIGGFTVVVKTDDWKSIDKGIFIEPESICDCNKSQFNFLGSPGSFVRIKSKRLRQIWSQGLLIPAPEGAEVGQDFWDELELRHYEPEIEVTGNGTRANFAKAPTKWGDMTKYDIDNGRKTEYNSVFTTGEIVQVTYKINGSNCGYVFSDEAMHVRSRSGFRENDNNLFWNCLTPEIEKFCRENPDHVLYGECTGQVKGYKYNLKAGEVKFLAFDIMQPNRQYCCVERFEELTKSYNIPTVPLYGHIPYDFSFLLELCESACPLGNPISEGIIVKSMVERRNYTTGRAIMKLINPKYLEKS